MDPILNIFNGNGFEVTTLSGKIDALPYVPSRLNEMGLFTPEYLDTTTAAIERRDGSYELVEPTPRGGAGVTVGEDQRELIPIIIPHFEINDSLMADSLQNVRAFGEARARETAAQKINDKFKRHTVNFAATEENARLGALQGLIVYKGGKQLDLYKTFDETRPTPLLFDLANKDNGELQVFCQNIVRKMSAALGGRTYTGIRAQVGDNFFDKLISNKEFRAAHLGWSAAQILKDSYTGPNRSVHGIVEFGGIVFENYRGADNSPNKIETEEAAIFPTGSAGLFVSAYAPADYIETVNTRAQRLYAKQYVMQNGKGIHLDSQMNALQYCTVPKALFKGKSGAS